MIVIGTVDVGGGGGSGSSSARKSGSKALSRSAILPPTLILDACVVGKASAVRVLLTR